MTQPSQVQASPETRRSPKARAAFAYGVAAILPLALTIQPMAAGALVLLLALVAPRIRRLPLRAWYPALGFLATSGAAMFVAWLRPVPALADAGYTPGRGLGEWALWLGVAALLAFALERLDVRHAAAVGLGSVVAALANAAVGLYQVAWSGQTQSVGFTYHPNLAAAAALVAIGGVAVGWRPLWRGGFLGRIALIVGLAAGLVALVATGSRSGMVGFAVGAAWWLLLALPRVRVRLLLVAMVAVVGVGAVAFIGDRLARGPASPNLLTNSGFEQGLASWSLQGSSVRETLEGNYAVLLSRGSTAANTLLAYAPVIPVMPGESLVISLAVRTAEPPRKGTAPVGVVLAVDALDGSGTVIARLGAKGWAPASQSVPGGRPPLPMHDSGWLRSQVTVPAVPERATGLTLALQPTGQGTATFGWVDSLQVERDSVAAAQTDHGDEQPVEFVEISRGVSRASVDAGYVPGQGPGLFGWAQPAIKRLRVFTNDPTGASGGRLAMWLVAADLAEARPVLGYGPGSEVPLANTYASSRSGAYLAHFHSLYFKVLLEGGVLFLGALLVLLGGLVAGLSRAALSMRQGALGATATLVALMTQSVFDPVLTLAGVAGGLWLVISVAGQGETQLGRRALSPIATLAVQSPTIKKRPRRAPPPGSP